MAVLLTPPDTEWVGLYRDALPSGSMDMSMQLSAMPAAKTLAVTEALAAPAAGVWPGSLKTDAHSPAMSQTSQIDASQSPGISPSQAHQHSFESNMKQRLWSNRRLSGLHVTAMYRWQPDIQHLGCVNVPPRLTTTECSAVRHLKLIQHSSQETHFPAWQRH